MQASNLHDLYVAALRKIHNGEKPIVDAFPGMAESATENDLQKAFEDHCHETGRHGAGRRNVSCRDSIGMRS